MGFDDPFTGYSFVLRTIVYVIVPAFTVFQFFRFKRALHVFQLEGYKRARFLAWCRENKERALFLRSTTQKKPLVMTGRAWRILWTATVLNVLAILLPSAAAHLAGGAPFDLITWAFMTGILFFKAPHVLVAADWLMTPVQTLINQRFESQALEKLTARDRSIVAITGSFGKTSTKFAVAGLLGPGTFFTPGSYNTPMGVTRAINEGLGDHRYVVIEMGAYRRGDIAELCATFKPTIGILTAVGPAHLERFGSIENIRKAKYEIVEALPPEGTAVMNVDDPIVRELADTTSHVQVIRYGIEAAGRPDVSATDVAFGPRGATMTISSPQGSLEVQTRLLGAHSVGHVLAGVAVAHALGVPLTDLRPRIAALQPVEHRLQLISGAGGVTVIDDAFNSNPAGARAAVDVLGGMEGAPKVVVTPGIVELGELQAQENEAFGRHAAEVADHLIVVGRLNREAIVAGARGGRADVIVVDSLAEATEKMKPLLRAGAVVLFENDLPDQYEG